jgi:hypothetical protein
LHPFPFKKKKNNASRSAGALSQEPAAQAALLSHRPMYPATNLKRWFCLGHGCGSVVASQFFSLAVAFSGFLRGVGWLMKPAIGDRVVNNLPPSGTPTQAFSILYISLIEKIFSPSQNK